MGFSRTLALLAALALGAAAAGDDSGAASPVGTLWSELPPLPAIAQGASAEAEERSEFPALRELVKKAAPAVVSIAVLEKRRRPGGFPTDPLHDFFGRGYGEAPAEGLGAGFVIHPSGTIVTNAHVVENAGRIRVTFTDQGYAQTLEARVVGMDPETDLALLQVDADHSLPVLPLGDSDSLEVADWVVAIGNPFGLSQSVTVGIVSQKGRTDIAPQGRHGYFDFIQTDASINPGNSGGPLLNLRGEVVAISNAVNASGQGIGFAVPINMAKKVLPQLAKDGKVERAWMGISIQDLSHEMAKGMGLHSGGGVVVGSVAPGSPAERAGIRSGDVILSLDGKPSRGARALRWEIACNEVGSQITLRLLRESEALNVQVRLVRRPEESQARQEREKGEGAVETSR